MSLTNLGGGAGAVGVEADAITQVESRMDSAISALRASVSAVDAAADAARAGWKGEANSRFIQVAQAWDDEATRLNQKLDELTAAVASGKATLVNMDQS
ncbi:WXG100 family type VII secretion target [Nocardia harenae]|uniref:WXG100 family type VII secretion target n=1 Tax=Nocardia harenae TaxID=358707 RepID=UPI00082BC1DB|nr:WXG100 family type VII secretion target [Nocardia harenae]